jgi:hypothetical protein
MLEFITRTGKIIKTDDWLSFDEQIVEMSIQVNEKESIVLEGFEAYLRIKEEVKGVNSSINGTVAIILFGKYGDKVAKVTLDLIHSKISQEVVPITKAYQNKPLNPSLWKKGLLFHPNVYIKKV